MGRNEVPESIIKRAETCVYCERLMDSIKHGVFREAAYSDTVVIMSRVIEEQQRMLVDLRLNGLPPVYIAVGEEDMARLKGEIEAKRQQAIDHANKRAEVDAVMARPIG